MLAGRTIAASLRSARARFARRTSFPPVAALLLSTATFAACGGGGDGIVRAKDPALSAVQLSPTSLSLVVTQTGVIQASLVGPGSTTGQGTISYSASDPAVASVSVAGLVTALSPGTTTITVTGTHPATNALNAATVSATAQITVAAPPNALTDLLVTPPTPTVTIGSTVQLVTTITRALPAVTTSCTFQSANATIAAVTNTGVVSGVSTGSAVITVSCSGTGAGTTPNTLVRTITATVIQAPVASVALSAPITFLQPGPGTGRTTATITATTRDAAGNTLTGRTVTWSSSNPAVAFVNATGLVTALSAGSTLIRATSETASDTVTVNVVRAFGAVHANQPTAASYSGGVNSAGKVNTVARSGVGLYTVTFPDLGVPAIGRNFLFMVNAVSGAPNATLSAPNAVCDLNNASNGAPISVTVRCANPATGNPRDAEFRVMVLGELSLSGPHVFTLHSAGNSAIYTPSASFSFNSASSAMSILPNNLPGSFGNLLVGHAQGLSFPGQPALVQAIASTPGQSCTNDFFTFNASTVNVVCFNSALAFADISHFLFRLTAGRPGRGAALTLALPDGSDTNQGFTSSGGVVVARTGTGKYTFTYPGLSSPASGSFVSASPWNHGGGIQCTHQVVSAAPLSIDVACFNSAGAFTEAFTALNLLVLQ